MSHTPRRTFLVVFLVVAAGCKDAPAPSQQITVREPPPADTQEPPPAQCGLAEVGGVEVSLRLPDDPAQQKAAREVLVARAKVLANGCAPHVEQAGNSLTLFLPGADRSDPAAARRIVAPQVLWIAPGYGAAPEQLDQIEVPAQQRVRLDVAKAEVYYNSQTRQPYVQVALTAKGGEALAEFTRTRVGRFLVMGVDDRVLMAPKIQEAITGGNLSITLGAKPPHELLAGSRKLVHQLNMPPLDAKVTVERVGLVGPAPKSP